MANMAYFNGIDSFLSVPHSSFFEFLNGGEDWSIKFNVKSDYTDGQSMWGAETVFIITKYDGTHVGELGFLLGGDWEFTGTPKACDGTLHKCEIKYTSAESKVEYLVDDVVIRTQTSTTPNWTSAVDKAVAAGKWFIGAAQHTAGMEGYHNFARGFFSEFEIWRNGTRVLYLPLTADLLDHSGNDIVVTVNNVVLKNSSTTSGGGVETVIGYAGGNWILSPLTTTMAGDLTGVYSINKLGGVVYFRNVNLSTTGKKVKTATLTVTVYDIGGGIGLGGSNVKAKIRAEKSANPSDISNAATFVAAEKTTAEVEILGQTYTADQVVVFDISSIITELLVYPTISRINLSVDDFDGRTTVPPANSCYGFEFNEIFIELEDAEATTYIVTYNGNGNTGGTAPTDASSPYASGATVTVLGKGDLVKTGNYFKEWNTQADGGGTGYDPDETFSIAANTTLYAIWSDIINVTYSANGGTGTPPVDTNNYEIGDTITVKANTDLAKTNYTFKGWNTAADGSGTDYDATGTDTFTAAADITLYAKWARHWKVNNVAPHLFTNYRCILEHDTDEAVTEPNIGSDWATYWSKWGNIWDVGDGLVLDIYGYLNVALSSLGGLEFDDGGDLSAFLGIGLEFAEDGRIQVYPLGIDHDSLANISGGQSSPAEFYHLTEDKYNQVEDNDHNSMNGLDGGLSSPAEYYHLPEDEYDALVDANAQLTALQKDGSPSFYGIKTSSSRGGGLIRKSVVANVTLSGGTGTIQVNIPATSRIIGCQLITDTAITSGDGGSTWKADYTGGSSEAICSGVLFTKDIAVDSLASAVVTAETDILITCEGGKTFSGGVITAVVYYECFEALTAI